MSIERMLVLTSLRYKTSQDLKKMTTNALITYSLEPDPEACARV